MKKIEKIPQLKIKENNNNSMEDCFTYDTKILIVNEGEKSFAELLEDEKKGIAHRCYTYLKAGIMSTSEFKNIRRASDSSPIIKILLNNGQEITCTKDHLFMLKDGTYKPARLLNEDDDLMLMPNKRNIKVFSVAPLEKEMPVYDLEVPNTNNFALANGIFVHNSTKQETSKKEEKR